MKKIIFILCLIFFAGICFASLPYSMKKADASGKNATLVVTYPVFIGNSELIKTANRGIYETVREDIERNRTFIEEFGDGEGFINTAYATVVRADEKIISVVWNGDWMAGGVHNDMVFTATYGMVNGKAKKLTVNDMGDPKVFAQKIYNAYLEKEMKLQQLEEGLFSPQAILEEEGQQLLNSFTVSDKFITFYRQEYEFGYGYEGADFVKILLK